MKWLWLFIFLANLVSCTYELIVTKTLNSGSIGMLVGSLAMYKIEGLLKKIENKKI